MARRRQFLRYPRVRSSAVFFYPSQLVSEAGAFPLTATPFMSCFAVPCLRPASDRVLDLISASLFTAWCLTARDILGCRRFYEPPNPIGRSRRWSIFFPEAWLPYCGSPAPHLLVRKLSPNPSSPFPFLCLRASVWASLALRCLLW